MEFDKNNIVKEINQRLEENQKLSFEVEKMNSIIDGNVILIKRLYNMVFNDQIKNNWFRVNDTDILFKYTENYCGWEVRVIYTGKLEKSKKFIEDDIPFLPYVKCNKKSDFGVEGISRSFSFPSLVVRSFLEGKITPVSIEDIIKRN